MSWLQERLPAEALPWVGVGGFLLGAFVVGLIYHHATRVLLKLPTLMPVASIFGIDYFTEVTTASRPDNLLRIGGILFLAAMLHKLPDACLKSPSEKN